MINKEIGKQILDQVHFEFQSERQYIAMEYYFRKLDLNGYADLFHEYALEERRHGYDMLAFLDDWNYPIIINMNKQEIINAFDSPMDVFEKALQHEKEITAAIVKICNNAVKSGDVISKEFLNKYLTEQREEEDKMQTRLMRLKLAGSDSSAILLLDHEDGKH